MSPTEWFASQVKHYRVERRWTQSELAERCKAAGLKWDRSVVANVESKRRTSVTIHEVFTLALVLGVPPVMLLLPIRTGEPVEIGGELELDAASAMRWLIGQEQIHTGDGGEAAPAVPARIASALERIAASLERSERAS
jgi:transcriptional regulator with XRE-family HTH domain